MKATYWQRGESLDYKNATAAKIEAGDVIAFGARTGIAGEPILPGKTGSIQVEGVFHMPKAAEAITAGAQLYLNASKQVTATSGEVKAGYAVEAAKADAQTVLVKLNA